MKILVLGSSGLLGSHLCSLYKGEVIPVNRGECDITNPFQVDKTVKKHKPDVIINCAGLTVKKAPVEDHIRVNAYAPKILTKVCNNEGVRIVHVSTDCVFDGDTGNYSENDIPQPCDPYGYSKFIGEITESPHMTVRCSFVGFPDPNQRSLLGWFYKQSNPVPGWKYAYWNGLTTFELSKILVAYALYPSQWNLVHVHGEETLTKYEILKTVNDVYGWGKDVYADPGLRINRTLVSAYPSAKAVVHKSFRQMVEEMKELEHELKRY